MVRFHHIDPDFAATNGSGRAISTLSQRWLWPALLVAASASASFAFTCVTPFAALAVVATATLPLRDALLTVAAIWLTNQAVGYGVLDYPWSMESASWGIAIGTAALISAGAAAAVRLTLQGQAVLAFAAALGAAFASYEVCLYLFSFILGSGEEAFASSVVARLALLNAVWAIALTALYEGWQLARAAGWVPAFRGMRIAARQ
jgi:hypothetical protein